MIPLPEKTGIYRGVPFDDYLAWKDAVSHSYLCGFDDPPSHVHYRDEHPTPATAAMTMGSAFHALILEPETFGGRFYRGLDIPHRSKADKAAHAEHQLANAGKKCLSISDWETIHGMRDSLLSGINPTALELLDGNRECNEISLVWTDEETGLRCKGRLDRLLKQYRGHPTIVDIKTSAKPATEHRRGTYIKDFHTHSQCAFYVDGLDAVTKSMGFTPVYRRHLVVMIETFGAHGISVFEIGPMSVEQGRREYRRWITTCAECRKSGVWPGYSSSIGVAELPVYARDGEF